MKLNSSIDNNPYQSIITLWIVKYRTIILMLLLFVIINQTSNNMEENEIKEISIHKNTDEIFDVNTYLNNEQIQSYETNANISLSSLIEHEPIIIENNDDFAMHDFPGSGTLDDPYKIEGYHILSSGDTGISISNSDVYFIIEGCLIEGAYFDGKNGIYIERSSNGKVNKNTLRNNWGGVEISRNTSDVLVSNNIVTNNYQSGLKISTNRITILNNTIKDNNRYGLLVSYSSNIAVENNYIKNNKWRGFAITKSSGHILIANNTFNNNGLYVFEGNANDYEQYTVINNSVNGKKIGWYFNKNELIIDKPIYGQIIVINSSDTTIMNQNLSLTDIGIYAIYCTRVLIKDNIISDNHYFGVFIRESNSMNVSRNKIKNTNYQGIVLWGSNNTHIKKNLIKNNDWGIWLRVYSNYNHIYENTIEKNGWYGVSISSYSNNNSVFLNNFIDNRGISSQAYDDRLDNKWYNAETKQGNYWSDWSGTGSYLIDGFAESEDIYPLSNQYGNDTTTHVIYPLFYIALIIGFVFILYKSKKRN